MFVSEFQSVFNWMSYIQRTRIYVCKWKIVNNNLRQSQNIWILTLHVVCHYWHWHLKSQKWDFERSKQKTETNFFTATSPQNDGKYILCVYQFLVRNKQTFKKCLFWTIFLWIRTQKLKCSVEGQFWSMRLISRCSVIPRTSTTTLFVCILKNPMFRIFAPPKPARWEHYRCYRCYRQTVTHSVGWDKTRV